jgi:hypothetical protein
VTGAIPGSLVQIPDEVIAHWADVHRPRVEAALRDHPGETLRLLHAANVAAPAGTAEQGIGPPMEALGYDIIATNDAAERLGGQPYENSRRIYFGSQDDLHLNRSVPRFHADAAALATIDPGGKPRAGCACRSSRCMHCSTRKCPTATRCSTCKRSSPRACRATTRKPPGGPEPPGGQVTAS